MAIRTIATEISPMYVIRTMAGMTIHRDFTFFDPPRVAARAGASLVRASKGKLGVPGVVESGFRPTRRRMASTALLAESAGVNIVACVTTRTRLRQLSFAGRLPMAGRAGRLAVSASQGKATLLLVIEILSTPGFRPMAICAVRSEPPRMRIVDRMTRNTILRRSFVAARNVTAVAAGLFVRPRQGVFRLVMIESSLSPTHFVMAFGTILRKRAPVCIVLFMTIEAGRRCLPLALVGRMTLRACDRDVPTAQGIIRPGMIEGGIAQSKNIRVPAAVVRMAASALSRRRQGIPAMKANALLQIVSDQFMTCETEPTLRLPFEGLMTGRAVLFEFRMGCRQGARHHHSLPIDRE